MKNQATVAVLSVIFLLFCVFGNMAWSAENNQPADPVEALVATTNQLYASGDKAGALGATEKAYKLCRTRPEKLSPVCQEARSNYGFLLIETGTSKQAIKVYSELIDDVRNSSSDKQGLISFYVHRARLYRKSFDYDKAVSDYLAAFDLAPTLPKLDHRFIGLIAIEYAGFQHLPKDKNKARAMLEAVIAAARAEKPEDPSRLAGALLERARLDEEFRNFSNAAPFIEEAHTLANSVSAIERPLRASINEFYAMDCEHEGKKKEANLVRHQNDEDQKKVSAMKYPGFSPEPISVRSPDYPKLALMNGIEGWVITSSTIDKDGSVTDVKIIDSYPLGLFEKASDEAARKWKYRPTFIAGQPAIIPDHYVQIRFSIRD